MKSKKFLYFALLFAIQLNLLAAQRDSLVLSDSLHLARLATFKGAWATLQERNELKDMVVMLKIDQDEWDLYAEDYKAVYGKTERLAKFLEGHDIPLVYIDNSGAKHRAVLFEISIVGVVLDQAETTAGLYFSLMERHPPENLYMWFHVAYDSRKKWKVLGRLDIPEQEYIGSTTRSRLFEVHRQKEFTKK